MNRRNFLGLAAALGGTATLSPLLSACGGSESSTGKTSGTIRFLTSESGEDTINVMKSVFAAFEEKHSGITIEAEFLGSEQTVQRLTQLIGAGTPPDMVKLAAWGLARSAAEGLLAEVDDVVEAQGDISVGSRLVIDGHDYMAPIERNLWLSFYRKDVFDAAGVEPPTTWADMRDIMPKLAASNPSVFPNLFVTNGATSYTANELVIQGWSNGAGFWHWDDATEQWAVSLDQQENAAALLETVAYFKERSSSVNSPPSGNYDYAEVNQAFASGKVALIDYAGSRTLSYLENEAPDIGDKTGTIPMAYGKQSRVKHGHAGLAIFKGGEVATDLVKELATMMTTGELHREYLWSVPGHLIPPSETELKGEWRSHPFIQSHPDLIAAIDKVSAGAQSIFYEQDEDAPRPNIAAGAVFNGAPYGDFVQGILTNNIDEQEALDTLVTEMKDALERFSQ